MTIGVNCKARLKTPLRYTIDGWTNERTWGWDFLESVVRAGLYTERRFDHWPKTPYTIQESAGRPSAKTIKLKPMTDIDFSLIKLSILAINRPELPKMVKLCQ